MNKDVTIIAIDPGSSNGGIAVWHPGQPVKAMRMPSNDEISSLSEFIERLIKRGSDVTVYIEKVTMFASDSNKEDNPGKEFRIKVMLANYERIIALLIVHKVKYVEVYPQTWQSKLGLLKRGLSKTQKKNNNKDYAQNCFPELKVYLWSGDALCILQFALMQTNNQSWLQANTKNNKLRLF